MMNYHEEQLEQALKDLSVDELEGVLNALVLVAEYQEGAKSVDPEPEGIYLVPPYGELIASGDMHCFAKPRADDRLVGSRVLVSGKKAYGVMEVGAPIEVEVGEFDDLFGTQHQVSRKERLQWWPEKDSLFLYPIEQFTPYPDPLPVRTPPCVQTCMNDVPFEEGQKEKPQPVDHPTSLRITIAKTQDQAIKGFSGRLSIDQDEGILIPLQPATGIWMKDTYVSLTVAFLDSDYKALSMVDLQPMDETVYLGPAGSAWALEASPVWFKQARVEVGDRIQLP